MPRPDHASVDFDRTPFIAIWEVTRACALACRHCRAEAIPDADPRELTTAEGFALLDELAAMGTPICVLSGGDPAERRDLLDLVRRGRERGMRMATIPAATPRLTREFVAGLRSAGLAQMALSLDGPTADVHDRFRGVPGAFELTMRGAAFAREVGLPLQINTCFSVHNREHFDAMADIVRGLGVVFWEVFFLVPMGRAREHALEQMSARDFEEMFERLARFARGVDFIVKIAEAPHYRRWLLQHGDAHSPRMRRDFGPGGSIGLAPRGVNSGNGHLFVNHLGEICPSGFLPLVCGNVRTDSATKVYREHTVFRELRNPDLLKGKCGLCEFRAVCQGSRARAYAMTGDYLAEEPFCAHEPSGGGFHPPHPPAPGSVAIPRQRGGIAPLAGPQGGSRHPDGPP